MAFYSKLFLLIYSLFLSLSFFRYVDVLGIEFGSIIFSPFLCGLVIGSCSTSIFILAMHYEK